MSTPEDHDELERLRALVGPSEKAYADLLADRDEAVRVAKEALEERGALSGHIVELNVMLSRARQDQEFFQVSQAMSPTERAAYLARRRIRTSVTPRLRRLPGRIKRTLTS